MFALVQELVREGGLHPTVRAFADDLKTKLPSLRQGGGGLAKPPDPAVWGRGITHSLPSPMMSSSSPASAFELADVEVTVWAPTQLFSHVLQAQYGGLRVPCPYCRSHAHVTNQGMAPYVRRYFTLKGMGYLVSSMYACKSSTCGAERVKG